MTSARSVSLDMSPIYIQPNNFADYLSNQQSYYLFLDIDGTLADFTLDPKDSVIPSTTLTILQKIQGYGVKIAIVTGRSLAEARQMLSPINLPIAATHGLEIALDGAENSNDTCTLHVDSAALTAIRQSIIESCMSYSGFAIETKPYSVALHYRQNPALADVACTIMSETIKHSAKWTLKHGKYVCEAVPKDVNKGTAILTLLKEIRASDDICPIFIGDDITDEAGFMAIQGQNNALKKPQQPARGMGIKVGHEPSCAHYYVNNITEVTVLLQSFLSFFQQQNIGDFESIDTDCLLPKDVMRHSI
ncbi:trehalose-phosphatase [Psychrobacter sp. 1176_08]